MSDSVKDKFSITFSIVGMFASHAVGSLSVFFCAEITPTVIRYVMGDAPQDVFLGPREGCLFIIHQTPGELTNISFVQPWPLEKGDACAKHISFRMGCSTLPLRQLRIR